MNFFNFFKKDRTGTKANANIRFSSKKLDGGGASKEELLQIYKGEHKNFDLACGSVNKQISTTAKLIGAPIILTEGFEWLQNLINDEAEIIHKMALVMGTHWIVPKLQEKKIVFEHIFDHTIGDDMIRINLRTGELEAVFQEIRINYPTGDFHPQSKQTIYRRGWTQHAIFESWSGGEYPKTETENILSILPIPFAFNSIGDIRGISAYSGVLRLMRDIHELRFNRDSILAKSRPKFNIQARDIDGFVERNMAGNGQSSFFDPYRADVITTLDGEKTEWVAIPSAVFNDLQTAITDNQTELLTSGLLPEMFSGKALTGNYASAEYNVYQGIEFIRSIRKELNKAWAILIEKAAKLHSYTTGTLYEKVDFSWDIFDMATHSTKAQVLQSVSNAVSVLKGQNLPISFIFDLLKEINPKMPFVTPEEMEKEFEEIKKRAPIEDYDSWGYQ